MSRVDSVRIAVSKARSTAGGIGGGLGRVLSLPRRRRRSGQGGGDRHRPSRAARCAIRRSSPPPTSATLPWFSRASAISATRAIEGWQVDGIPNSSGRLGWARARAHLEAAAEPAHPPVGGRARKSGDRRPGRSRGLPRAPVAADDIAGLLALAEREQIDLVVCGPEGPLAAGLGDAFAAPRRALLRTEPGRGGDRELQDLRQAIDGRGGRADGRLR